jgi:hypothetical protein
MHCDILDNQNGLEQGDVLYPLLFTFDLQYNFRVVQENLEGRTAWGTSASGLC